MYSKIVNPATGRKVSISGKLGKQILQNYLNSLQYGGAPRKKSRLDDVVPSSPLEKSLYQIQREQEERALKIASDARERELEKAASRVPDENGNINCENCTNCKNCTDCNNCHDCTKCENCTDCNDCHDMRDP